MANYDPNKTLTQEQLTQIFGAESDVTSEHDNTSDFEPELMDQSDSETDVSSETNDEYTTDDEEDGFDEDEKQSLHDYSLRLSQKKNKKSISMMSLMIIYAQEIAI